jgi:uncharacterized membrane protein
MAISESQSIGEDTTYLIQPNRSLTPCQLALACGVICTALTVVALYFCLQGAWLIAPFAGLEIALVVSAICWQCRWSGQKQRIRIDEKRVSTDSPGSSGKPVQFPRGWLRVELIEPLHAWHPKRLLIGAHGRYLEVGAFLEESEREKLAQSLRSAVQQTI